MIYQSNRTEQAPPQQQQQQQQQEQHATDDNNNRSKQSSTKTSSNNATTNDPTPSEQTQAAAAGGSRRPQPPRQPRPIRPNLRRQVVVAARDIHHQASVPVGAQIELATVLPASRARCLPPKRPAHLPTKYEMAYGVRPAQAALINPETGSPVGASSKPNRYAWAQVPHHWHADSVTGAGVAGAPDRSGSPYHHHHHFVSPLSSAASRVLVVNPMHIVNLSEHTKSRLIKFIEAVKRFSEKWFSHVLLLMFLAVYACFGAYIFISFEAPTEQWEKQLIIDTRQRIVNESWHEAQAKGQPEFVDSFRTKFEEYEQLLNRVCASGMTSSSLENQWTFWGALFYSMTVFTTIGYGHLTPITFAGRVATMVYAIFGIPILLMVLADLGKLLTRIIKSAFRKFRNMYNKLLGRKASIRTRKLISDNTSQYIGVAKDAFERGFAYIQPYNKIPHAFRGASFRSKGRNRPAHQNATLVGPATGDIQEIGANFSGNGQVGVGEKDLSGARTPDVHVEAPAGKKHSMTTDTIVTPGKQTKPVSPPVEATANERKLQADNGHHEHGNSNKHHHGRSQSPGKTAKRKISTNKQADKQTSAKPEGTKGSVSRSSSTSNVADKQKLEKGLKKDASVGKIVTPNDAPTATVTSPEGETEKNKDKETPPQIAPPDELDTSDEAMTSEEFEDIDEDLDIPVSFALFLLVTYMMLGAVVFSIWEGWNFFDSLYFVFISMSTIGFGDLVPQHPKRMIGTFIYLLLGLALTSMCINVVQERIHSTFERAKMQIGEKMGLDLDFYDDSMAMGGDEDDDVNSQTNSSSLVHVDNQQHLASDSHLQQVGADERKLRGPSSVDGTSLGGDNQSGGAAATGGKLSRSKESLKYKRRGPSSSTDGPGGGSLRRKASKKIIRQATTSSQAPNPTDSLASGPTPAPGPAQTPAQPTLLEPQRKTIADPIHQPSLNCPVPSKADAAQMCEPLASLRSDLLNQPAFAQRAKLVATRSQPSDRPMVTNSAATMRHYPANSINNNNYGTGKTYAKSESPSRRASVSNELNQLDDLIKVLSRTPSERFGPLLGIPSSSRTSTRSNSPSTNSTFANRRGTSMRPSTTSPRPPIEKKRSLIVHSPSASSHLGGAGGTTPNSGRLSARESQLALDDLESIKYSAV